MHRLLISLCFLFVGFAGLSQETAATTETVIAGHWTSILPPLIAILMALLLREVIVSLLVGILVGIIVLQFNGSWHLLSFAHSLEGSKQFIGAVGSGLLDLPFTIQTALFDADHLSVILFTLFIGAMVAIISKNGGMMALVKKISKKATTARSGQMATYLLGISIFFDDYANTLVVGKTMRPLTDRLKISREKLAYIVDSTAAPVAAIAFITTWIGAELGYISDGVNSIPNGPELLGNSYGIFFDSLKYSFYPILTLFFIFVLIRKQRDFGPMFRAEKRARSQNVPKDGIGNAQVQVAEIDEIADDKENMWNALIPIFVLIGGAIFGLIATGYSASVWNGNEGFLHKLSATIGNADSYKALIWSSFGGLATAILLTTVRNIKNITETVEMALEGIKLMIPAIAILSLAWALANVTKDLHTAEFLASTIGNSVSAQFLPTIVFILAASIAFATGTSWGTMSILYAMVLGATWSICQAAGLDLETSRSIFVNVVACVLAGAVLGDHCSPISDTTILSSMASDCNHIDHVRTQMPYALTVGGVSILFGTLPAGFGVPGYITFPIAALVLYGVVSYFGKSVENTGFEA
ncbi:MAG: Na+/H+ antiporter NhaC [Bacteroidia bacterium]|jgi:Na+/H+ antiporter NhaC